jgi:hypothetical protein
VRNQDSDKASSLLINVLKCSACQGNHTGVMAVAMAEPVTLITGTYTHHYNCPTAQTEVLVLVEDTPAQGKE